MGGDAMNVSLAANRFVAQTAAGIGDDAEKEHAPLELRAILFAAHIHYDRVDRIGTIALRIAQTAANIIKSPELRFRTENAAFVSES